MGGGDSSGAPREPLVRALSTPIAPETIERLRQTLRALPEVAEAWLVELSLSGEDVLLAAFALPGLSQEAADAAAARAGELIAPLLPRTLYDGTEVRALTDPGLAAAVADADAPVYRRAPA